MKTALPAVLVLTSSALAQLVVSTSTPLIDGRKVTFFAEARDGLAPLLM